MKKLDTLQDATVVTIDPRRTLGPIRPMNAVNNGPAAPNDADFVRCNFHSYKAARIPYARIHDSNHCVEYGAPHTVDVTAIFPDFDADVDDPASYNFEMTDKYLGTIVAAGTEVFFRLAPPRTRPPRGRREVWEAALPPHGLLAHLHRVPARTGRRRLRPPVHGALLIRASGVVAVSRPDKTAF